MKTDATRWHNWAVEWTPTSITTFLDGRKWYGTTDRAVQPPGPMHLCIQLDWFPSGSGTVRESTMEVDWVREYDLWSQPPGGAGPTGYDGLSARVQPNGPTVDRVSELHERTTAPDGPPRDRAAAGSRSSSWPVWPSPPWCPCWSSPCRGPAEQWQHVAAGAAAEGILLDPSQRLDTEAAMHNGWTLIEHDEFDGDELDEDKWSPYSGKTTDDVGQHDPDNITVSDGTVKLTSRDDKTSAGMWWKSGHKYGRWEARVRSQAGNGYGPVMLLWPESGDWPEDGEIDMMEIPKGDRTKAHFTVHWGEDNEQDAASVTGDFTQWHNFAVEWTPDHIIGYLDGVEFYRNEDSDAAAGRDALRAAAGHRPVRQRLDPGAGREHAERGQLRGRLGARLRPGLTGHLRP